jgi:F0F1-type ATP synthase membrane subunit b/b'
MNKPNNTRSTILSRLLAVVAVCFLVYPVPQDASADVDRLMRQAADAKEDIHREKKDAREDINREKKDAKGDVKREKKDARGDVKREKKDARGDVKRDIRH